MATPASGAGAPRGVVGSTKAAPLSTAISPRSRAARKGAREAAKSWARANPPHRSNASATPRTPGRVRQRRCIQNHCSGDRRIVDSTIREKAAVKARMSCSRSPVVGGGRAGSIVTRWRPSRSRWMNTGTTGAPDRSASRARLFDVEAGSPKNGTNTPSRRVAF